MCRYSLGKEHCLGKAGFDTLGNDVGLLIGNESYKAEPHTQATTEGTAFSSL